ncbi:hypothetical protein NW755_003588 [Fusarium falciforme]|uniref:Uncharacterized protein n=1 Tax=Fusarium falciforme TaxID=195108 RepID=A0A9W8RCS5_9HYPO|nr:hypothetical protein NW755_003588 [Fusarium falciforme]
MSPKAASQDPRPAMPAAPPFATHDEPTTALDEISQPGMNDAADEEAVSSAAHDSLASRSLRLPQTSTDAAQTDSQAASVPANTSNSSGTESRVTREIQRVESEIFTTEACCLVQELTCSAVRGRTLRGHSLSPYDLAAIELQMLRNGLRIKVLEELPVSLDDLTFDLDTLLLSARGVEEAQLHAMMEDVDIWGDDEL